MAANVQFKFTIAVQEKILAVLWTDVQSYNIYRECIKPKYFQKSIHIDICRLLFDYWTKYGKPPTEAVLVEEVEAMVEKSKAKQKLESEYLDCIERLAKMDLHDYDYVKDKIIEFGKKQAMVEAIMECAEIIESGKVEDYDRVNGIIQNAQMVGEDVNDIGMDFWDGYESRLISYGEEEDVIERFPTGMDALDIALKGGLGRTEMGVILAPPGRGKTTAMQKGGITALKHGKNVVHISLENNEKQIMRNYDIAMLGHPLEYINENVEKCYKALGYAKRYGAGNLFVKKYATKKASVDTIRMYLNKLMVVKGIKLDVLIVDYGALLKPLQTWNDKRNTLEGNYEDLRALADEYNVALWTGAQGNRSSLSKKIVTMEDLAEAFAIANTADVMVALCQTVRERSEEVIRAFLTKNRDGVGEVLLKGKISYDTKNITLTEDITHSMIEEDGDNEDDDSDERPRRGGRKPKEKSAYDKE